MIKVTRENSPECFVSLVDIMKPFNDLVDKIVAEAFGGKDGTERR